MRGLTKESRDEGLLDDINRRDRVNVEVSTLLDRATHHAQSHLVERAWNWESLLLYQLKHQICQLGEWTVQHLQPSKELSRTSSESILG